MVTRVAAAVLTLTLTVPACRSGTDADGTERWAADLASNRQVLFMTLQRQGSTVSGSGTLASLTNPGGESLRVSGVRVGDSLRVTFNRALANPFQFAGRYTGPGIVGVLDGAEFARLSVAFRSR